MFAVPGRIHDPFSEGANYLIRTNRAALIQKPEDIELLMGWKTTQEKPQARQRSIFMELTPEEEKIMAFLQVEKQAGIDAIALATGLTMSKISASLLNLEFESAVKCLPGKVYVLL